MFDSKKIAKQALLRVNEIETKKNTQRRIKSGIVSMLGLCAASVVIVFMIFSFGNLSDDYIFIDDGPAPLAAFPFLQVDDNAKPYTGTKQDIKIPDIRNLSISADTFDFNMPLFNPHDNTCYFVFEIILEDNDESLFKSGLIEPGMYIENLTLSRTLTLGEYNAVLIIHFYELESFVFLNSISVLFSLSVA